MKLFWAKTNSIPWAVSLAGAVSKAPKEFRCALVSDDPLIKMIGEAVGGTKPVGEELVLPNTETEFEWLDQKQAQRMQREMEEIHGLVMEQQVQVVPLQYPQLASNLLLHKYQVFTGHGYFCPDPLIFNKRQVQKYSEYTILLESMKFKDQALAFCDGWEIEDREILDLSTLSSLEQVFALAALSRPSPGIVLLSANNPLNYVARSWYTDIYCLRQRPVILSVLPADQNDLDRRTALFWSQQIPVMETDSLEMFKSRGFAWKVRWECGFDNHEYYRRKAQGMYS